MAGRPVATSLPTLLIVIGMMVVPLAGIIIVSFWSQTGFDLQATWTLDNYALMLFTPGRARSTAS